jgi:hypothetical protein
MSKTERKAEVSRRSFLGAVGTGAGAVAAAAAAGAAATPAVAAESAADKKKARYQASSAHVQAFYRTNRY